MSLHFLLDGYNIIHQAPGLAHGSLEARRFALVRWLGDHRPQGSVRNLVTVVFDGNPAHFSTYGGAGGDIKVIFSDGENADACLKSMVEHSRHPKDLVVVSDDKEIKLYARALGAKVLSVRQFAADLFSARGGSASGGHAEGRRPSKGAGVKKRPVGGVKYISLVQAQKINEEMEKIWLK